MASAFSPSGLAGDSPSGTDATAAESWASVILCSFDSDCDSIPPCRASRDLDWSTPFLLSPLSSVVVAAVMMLQDTVDAGVTAGVTGVKEVSAVDVTRMALSTGLTKRASG